MQTSSDTVKYLLELFARRDREIEQRIEAGIAQHRKARVTLRCTDAAGRPVSGVKVRVQQVRHEFLFGANIFMLGGYDSAEQNRTYEAAFLDVFNAAVVPCYWSDLEPEEGHPRFTAQSRRIPRRPPPDVVLDFCDQHRLTAKGHCLVWHQWLPQWLPRDPEAVRGHLRRRLEQIAQRYGQRVTYWDVVNEAMERYLPYFLAKDINLPRDYVLWSYQQAKELFPPQTKLFLNEATRFSWNEYLAECTPLYMQVENLLLRGAKIDGLGLQYHTFFHSAQGLSADPADLVKNRDSFLDPRKLLQVLDLYARLGLPIQISEITLPAYGVMADGEELQAELLRELYRVWFSHPQVEAIFWWNLPDGGAHGPEISLGGGLLHPDLQPKRSYQVLRQLVREEWTTRAAGVASPEIGFDAFFGEYAITAEYNGRTTTQTVQISQRDERGPRGRGHGRGREIVLEVST